jgi:hypothetical protein
VVGHNLGTFLQRARSGRGCSARASAGDRAVAAQDGLDCYAVSRDHRRIIDAGGRYPQLMGLGVGKRRWYATIFSFDKPRSRSISTERRGRSLSRAGPTPRSSSPSLPCRPLVFTCASSVSSRPFLPIFHVNVALLRTTHALPLCAISASKTRIQLLLFNRLSRRTTGGKERRGQQVLQVRPCCRNPMKVLDGHHVLDRRANGWLFCCPQSWPLSKPPPLSRGRSNWPESVLHGRLSSR